MGRSVHSHRKLPVALLAVTAVVGLTAGAILAQSNPPGPAARLNWLASWARTSNRVTTPAVVTRKAE